MKVALTIPPTDWMQADETRQLMRAINSTGQNALFVGGCVRNHLMGEPVTDIDIACKYTPDQTIKILTAHNIRTIPTGIDHGTVTALINKKTFEITSLRKDINPKGRKSTVTFGSSWEDDALRRDFTINALYADSDGNIFDPTGYGITDIKSKTVRFIGDPETRIHEDHLRILRFCRFSGRYSPKNTNKHAFAACKNLANHIDRLSNERIVDEFYKTLKDDSAPQAFAIMKQANIFPIEQQQIEALAKLIELQKHYNSMQLDSRYYLFKKINKYIKKNKINKFFKSIHELKNQWKIHPSIPQTLYKFGADVTLQGMMIIQAESKEINHDRVNKVINAEIPILPVTAKDIMEYKNLKEGPEVGSAFKKAETLWLESNCTLSKDEILKAL